MASAFDEFVKRKTAPKSDFNRTARIEKYCSKVNELFERIDKLLRTFIDEGTISFERELTTISEEALGPYDIERATITIGETRISLMPVGTILFGGIGRVDLVGRGEKIMLVLVPKDVNAPQIRVSFSDEKKAEPSEIDWNDFVWKIAIRDPGLRYIDLEQESFQDALMSVAG